MLTRRARSASRALAVTLGLLSAVLALAGCRGSSAPRLTPPMVNESPYDPAAGDVLWAVVPLRNESGTSLADPLILSDKVVSAVAEARGLRCLPLNRTLATMRALELPAIRTPAEAQALARALGADGVLVGSITAYDPYVPTIGLTIALHGRPGAMNASPDRTLDARALTGRTDEPASQAEGNFSSRPLSVAA
ncbi:MAG: hypothetical protein JNK70_12975, partial [Phycisphaerae bacterium]|nr:hypothetical protein [Phycisphaerae bacterium]